MSARIVVAVAVAISITVVFAVCATVNGSSEPINEENSDRNFAIHYLQNYGYLNEENAQAFRTTAEQSFLNHSISLFQEYYNLRITGKLNVETLNQMRKPRCGLQDIPDSDAIKHTWRKTHLTWNFKLATKETLDTARAAFDLWRAKSKLTFERDVLHPNILISWNSERHMYLDSRNGEECSHPFDGPGGVLAHAFYPSGHPNFTSEIHLDIAEQWHIFLDKHPTNKENLLYVLAHEIGHSLGLSHSSREESIMYAFTSDNIYPVTLSNEDIMNIQNLYGSSRTNVQPRTTTTTTTTTTTEVTPKIPVPPDLCELKRVDVILVLEKRMYIVSGRYIWLIRLNNKKIYGEPLLLSNYLKFLRSNFTRLTASYRTPSGHIMLFVNNKIYKVDYPTFTVESSWPKSLKEFGLPEDARINAAINTNQGISYVIYNDYIVGEIDECKGMVTKHHTIHEIFPGLPRTITSAFRGMDGNLYFIAGRQFYKFNEFTGIVLSAGMFDLQIVDIACPRDGLLQQLRDLLNGIARSSSNAFLTSARDDDDDDDDDDET